MILAFFLTLVALFVVGLASLVRVGRTLGER